MSKSKRIAFLDLPEDMQTLIGDIVGQSSTQEQWDRLSGHIFTVREIPVSSIEDVAIGVTKGDTRDKAYASKMIGAATPPIVFYKNIWLDGKHRVWAAKKSGKKLIDAIDLSELGDLDLPSASAIGGTQERVVPSILKAIKSLSPAQKRKFTRGGCGDFALALHRLYRLKLGAVFISQREKDGGDIFSHAFVFHPEDSSIWIDAEGARDSKAILMENEREFGRRAKATWREIDSDELEGQAPCSVEDSREATRLLKAKNPPSDIRNILQAALAHSMDSWRRDTNRTGQHWLRGYCAEYAKTLAGVLGKAARLGSIVGSDGDVHHIVVLVGDLVIDARGVFTRDELFEAINRVADESGSTLKAVDIIPFDPEHELMMKECEPSEIRELKRSLKTPEMQEVKRMLK